MPLYSGQKRPHRTFFAYGANMNPRRLARVCPSAEVLAVARLEDHAMGFFGHSKQWDSGMETVVAAPGESLWGVVFKLSFPEGERLDALQDVRLDGTGAYFQFPDQVVDAGGNPYAVLFYKKDGLGAATLPSAEYLDYIVEGAVQRGLPSAYTAKLRALPSRAAAYKVPKADPGAAFLPLADACSGCA